MIAAPQQIAWISVKIHPITETINRALDAAGLVRHSATGATDVRAVIDRALQAAGLSALHPPSTVPSPAKTAPRASAEPTGTGEFLSLSHASEHGSRDYLLYVPSIYIGQPMPLIVMLHGCKQNPIDFATGTRMNALAERHGFLVAYPSQTARSNGANCWNWFERSQQDRDGAEPSLIAGIAKDIAASYAVQRGKVFVAGLSAGAAMAVILGRAYPDVFAAVASHSGLPLGAAHDVGTAFAAMHRGAAEAAHDDAPGVRTIVFHGDADATVNERNGAAIVDQAVQAFERHGTALQRLTRLDAECGGRRCTSSTFTDASDRVLVEHWRVHGAAHAWSGGDAAGSYADAAGPDASAEIVRFFLELPE